MAKISKLILSNGQEIIEGMFDPKPPVQGNDPGITERLSMPTPVFFQKLRNAGLIMAAVAGIILTSPLSLPAIVTTIAGYVALTGGVLSAVSQSTIPGDK